MHSESRTTREQVDQREVWGMPRDAVLLPIFWEIFQDPGLEVLLVLAPKYVFPDSRAIRFLDRRASRQRAYPSESSVVGIAPEWHGHRKVKGIP